MSELREEKRHRIRPGVDHTGEDVVEALDKTANRVESKLWMKWGVSVVGALFFVIMWLGGGYVKRIEKQAEDGATALAEIKAHQVESNKYIEEFKDMKRAQQQMALDVQRMATFFETKYGMPPREVRSRRRREEDN
jgi:hypothetical protein